MTEEDIKSRFIETRYKQLIFDDEIEEEEEDEPNWAAMGLNPQGAPVDEELQFEWVPIVIDRLHVWGVSSYEGDTILWINNRSISIDMKYIEALETFLYRNLDIK